MRGLIFLTFMLFISAKCANVRRTPVVQTKSGPVQGAILTTVWNSVEYSSFKGIPYAAPPIGNLRYRPPVPPEPWNDTRDVIEEPNKCPQTDYSGVYFGNEDCLNLNVFSPQTNFSDKSVLKPVMVWLVGGFFIRGAGNTSFYGPDFFMEQDVLMVSFSHRLGALGYLYLDHPRITSNAALKDELMVLKWVRDNIAAFGGDPKIVTLFGESSGSAEVIYHVLSRKSNGLFHRAIAQSGTALSYILYQRQEAALRNTYALANKLGFYSTDSEELIRFFLQADAKDLVQATDQLPVLLKFGPIKENSESVDFDDIFLPECPVTIAANKSFNNVPMIMGFNHDELLFFTDQLYSVLDNTVNILNQYVPFLQINKTYPNQLLKQLSVILSDYVIKPQVDFTQRIFQRGNGEHPIYYYQLSHVSKYSIHKLFDIPVSGVSHGDDIAYMFNVQLLNAPKDPQDPFNQFRRKFVTLWANFAKYGNPTPKDINPLNNVIWESSGKDGKILNIANNFQMIDRSKAIDEEALLTETLLYFLLPFTSNCDEIIYVNYSNLF